MKRRPHDETEICKKERRDGAETAIDVLQEYIGLAKGNRMEIENLMIRKEGAIRAIWKNEGCKRR